MGLESRIRTGPLQLEARRYALFSGRRSGLLEGSRASLASFGQLWPAEGIIACGFGTGKSEASGTEQSVGISDERVKLEDSGDGLMEHSVEVVWGVGREWFERLPGAMLAFSGRWNEFRGLFS